MKLKRNKKFLKTKLFCLFLLVLFVSCKKNSETLFRRAEKNYKENRYIEAVLAYTTVITGDNDLLRQKSYYRIALIHYLTLKNFQKAIEIFEIYLKKYPDGNKADEILKLIGDIYTNNFKKHDYAIGEYQKLIDYYPDSPLVLEAIINIGKCYFKINNYYQAIVEFEKAKKRFPESPLKPKIDLEIASSFYLLGETKKAIDIYKNIIEKSTKNPLAVVQAKYNLATIYEEKEELDKALKLYKTIQFTYPNPAVINLKIDRVNYRRNVQKR